MKKTISVVIYLVIACSLAAQPPKFFKYQGIARDSTGNPVSNDTIALRISIHRAAPGGTIVYQETFAPITNEFGSFNINIGGGVVLSGNFTTIPWNRYAFFQEVELDISGGSNYVSMGTSQYLSVPYSLATDSALYAMNATNTIKADSARYGIGPFKVQNFSGGNTEASVAIIAEVNSPPDAAPAFYAKNNGLGSSFYAESGNGIFVLADSSGLETNGRSFLGGNVQISNNGNLSVSGNSSLAGLVTINNNLIVGGSTLTANTINASTVSANTMNATGLLTVTGSETVNGNLYVTGSISKGSGSFKIDHPLDPMNKYLYHSFVESPDMKNIYDGTVVTDKSGNATIELPEYFDVLNKDYRYQLTCIGSFAQAIVSNEIKNNRFKIRTNKPHIKVSWQVTGIRNDAYAKKHRIIPEVEKEESEKGKYLYPDSFKQN